MHGRGVHCNEYGMSRDALDVVGPLHLEGVAMHNLSTDHLAFEVLFMHQVMLEYLSREKNGPPNHAL